MFAAAVLAAAIGVVLIGLHPRYSVYILVGDDAGYYFAIARNFLLGHGVSFDRLQPTNGFNPLLTVLLIGTYRLLAPDLSLEACYRIGASLTWIVQVVASGLWVQLVGRILDPVVFQGRVRALAVAASFAFFWGFVGLKRMYGQDGGLVLCLGLAYLARVAARGVLAPGVRAALIDGTLLGLLVLARVDSLPLLAAAALVWTLGVARGTGSASAALLRLGVALAWILPYVAWSVTRFGSWLPISARIKSGFPIWDMAASLDAVLHTSLSRLDLVAFSLGFAIALVATPVLVWRMRGADGPRRDAGPSAVFLILSLYTGARIGYLLLFSRNDVQGSYALLVHPYLVLALFGAAAWAARRAGASGRLAGLGRRVAPAAALLLVLTAGGIAAAKVTSVVGQWRGMRPGGAGDETALARAIHEATGPEAVLYGGSYGLLGFFSDRPWVNGDGVANSFAYQRALSRGDLAGFLEDLGVTHIVSNCGSPGEPYHLTVGSMLLGGGSTVTAEADDLVLRSESARGGGGTLCVYRYRGGGR